MSTTLTNGLKLPDKGSVDWYADMQNNYTILDGAVGTVAEHTSALAGKAPLVHTHTKSDITDLFNSANEWTDLQSYTQSVKFKVNLTIGAAPSSDLYGGFNFGNAGTNIGNITARVSSAGATYSRLYIGNKFANGALDPNGTWKYTELQVGLRANGDKYLYTDGSWRNNLLPHDNNTYDLGSPSYQWNNLYAKNYYYNGVAWGLDKVNTWSNDQIIASSNDKSYYVKDTVYELGQTYSNGERLGGLTIQDKNGATVGLLDIVDRSYGNMEMRIRVRQKFDPDSNNRSTSGTILYNEVILGIALNKTNYIGFNADLWGANHNLGTSTNKWKSLNGVNPGALSLPKEEYSDVDISAQGLNWDLTGSSDNSYTSNRDGWLEIWVKRTSLPTAYISVGNAYVRQVSEATVFNFACVTCPVRNGQTYTVRILANECHVRIMKAEGNV